MKQMFLYSWRHRDTKNPHKHYPLCYLVSVNLSQSRVTWKEGLSPEELLPSDWLPGIFLINDWYKEVQFTVGSATPGLVVQGYTTEQTKQASTQHFSPSFFFSTCLQVPDWDPVLTSLKDELWHGHVSQTNSFLLRASVVSILSQQLKAN